ncbi:hypothetical protein IJ00_06615 [Calothrix sp. 336/3]|uniref:hypothetical protein n=1 Tax=Calothrix sp. 336/3 TaxID=1337936 RepID=UPI0004E30AB0|nr:hypothetical protein [Calothrix sp. 336/3]AKG21014.1 hypothetical protein IJ00_06615 [Calothrix sp. 336/3]
MPIYPLFPVIYWGLFTLVQGTILNLFSLILFFRKIINNRDSTEKAKNTSTSKIYLSVKFLWEEAKRQS